MSLIKPFIPFELTIILLALFFVGITNINAQTDAVTTEEVSTEEVNKECPFTKNSDGKLICVKTGKVCDEACKNKAKGKCCKGKSKGSSCSKSKTGGFDYNKSNDYGGNSSSSKCKTKKVKKCAEGCAKPCCVLSPSKEETPSEE